MYIFVITHRIDITVLKANDLWWLPARDWVKGKFDGVLSSGVGNGRAGFVI